jgi:hypothetical protein
VFSSFSPRAGLFFFDIYTRDVTPSLGRDPGGFIWLTVWELILSISFLLLAWLSFKAERELWSLKERGRHLALFSMPLFLLVGGLAFAGENKWWTAIGTTICVFSVFSFMYLQLPSIRKRFAAPLARQS